MGSRDTTTNRVELFALLASAGPFVGFGAAEVTGVGELFVLGVALFISWMFVAAVVFTKNSSPDAQRADAPEENPSDA